MTGPIVLRSVYRILSMDMLHYICNGNYCGCSVLRFSESSEFYPRPAAPDSEPHMRPGQRLSSSAGAACMSAVRRLGDNARLGGGDPWLNAAGSSESSAHDGQ